MAGIFTYPRAGGLGNLTLTITDTELRASFAALGRCRQDEAEDGVIPEQVKDGAFSVTLDELRATEGFDDGACMSFNMHDLLNGDPIEWKNLFLDTLHGRRDVVAHVKNKLQWNAALRVIVPTRHITSLRQCNFFIATDPNHIFPAIDLPVTEVAGSNDFEALQFKPVITGPATVAPGQTAQYAVQLQDSACQPVTARATIYLEPTLGVADRARVELDEQGQGQFFWTAPLEPGAAARIKSGFRYFPGAFELRVETA